MKKRKFIYVIFAIMFFPILNVCAIEKVSCGNITAIPKKIPELVSSAITIIQVSVPIILVIMGSMDLFKGITAQKEDEIKKGQQIFIKRLIVSVIIFFVVVIVKFLISIVSDSSSVNIVECIDCFISLDCEKYTGNNNNVNLNPSTPPQNDTNKVDTNDKNESKPNINKVETNSSGDNNKEETKPNKNENEAISTKIYSNLFVGDSRTVGMCQTYKLCEGYEYIAEVGKGYSWFTNTAISKVNSKIKSKNYNIIILMGVNDVGSNGTSIANKYYNKIYELATTTWKNQKIIFVSVNPVKDGKSNAYMSGVNSFNNEMKTKINSSKLSNLKYCDTISNLNMSTIDSGDGLHYNKTGYTNIYNNIKNNCLK